MFYKGIIFDLDDTIYNYKKCNELAVEEIINYIIINNNKIFKNNNETRFNIKTMYDDISSKTKYELNNTASSHNKCIYIKQLLEKLNLSYSLFKNIEKLYWESFYKNIQCYDGVKEFIEWNKKIGIKIGILTDYETEHQIIKLEKLDIIQYIDYIVTSEEVGIEKPSIQMFSSILKKMKLNSDEVIMIGDNYDKDIKGSQNANILSYWYNEKNTNFNNFNNLYIKFKNIHNEIEILKTMSKYCGERFDLVQAGGGNISVKFDELMFIKASGYNLTSVDNFNGYTIINNSKLLEDITNNIVKDVTEYNFIGNKRGSIETYMHSILKKYTVHLHPIQINKVLISSDAEKIIKEIYPESLIIEYLTPGIKVCNKIKELYNEQNVIFLLNHGIIITSNNINDIYELLNNILTKFEDYQQLNFEKYKYTNKISRIVNTCFNIENITYFCEDLIINKYLIEKRDLFKLDISFPDALIYCGVHILFGINNIQNYKNKYNEYPKIIIENNLLYISSHSLMKCKEIEDVLKSNLIILDSNYNKNYLSIEEICFLNNWDAEKYRKLL